MSTMGGRDAWPSSGPRVGAHHMLGEARRMSTMEGGDHGPRRVDAHHIVHYGCIDWVCMKSDRGAPRPLM